MPEQDFKNTSDSPYTNREIREKWHDMANDLQEILTQTKKTNGSVADINRWRERANGAFLAAGVLTATVILPIVGYVLYKVVNIDQSVRDAVHESLSAYDIQQVK